MTGRYVNRDADPLRQLADRVSSRIAAAIGDEVSPVVPVGKGAAS